MGKKPHLILALLALCFIQPVFGQQILFGASDCGSWVSKRTEPDKAWLLGYLSGINQAMYATYQTDFLKQIYSAEQIFLWMDNHCRSNPLDRGDAAANKLVIELVRKQ